MAIKPAPKVRKLVIVEESLISSMANNPAYLKEFPFLKALQGQVARGGCGGCGRKSDTSRTAIYTSAKQTLASMADDKRRVLKKMLNANQVRVSYKQGSRVVVHTF